MPLCAYEACGSALIFQMHSNADNMLFGYVSHIDCKCMPMQCHRCNHICSVISTHSLSWTTTIVWNWTSMEMYHIWLYITGVFADFAPRTLMREVPKRRGMKQGALERQYCLWWMQLTWQWFWTLGPAMEHKTSSNRQLGRTQHSPLSWNLFFCWQLQI